MHAIFIDARRGISLWLSHSPDLLTKPLLGSQCPCSAPSATGVLQHFILVCSSDTYTLSFGCSPIENKTTTDFVNPTPGAPVPGRCRGRIEQGDCFHGQRRVGEQLGGPRAHCLPGKRSSRGRTQQISKLNDIHHHHQCTSVAFLSNLDAFTLVILGIIAYGEVAMERSD